jgi:hypothetical protein
MTQPAQFHDEIYALQRQRDGLKKENTAFRSAVDVMRSIYENQQISTSVVAKEMLRVALEAVRG